MLVKLGNVWVDPALIASLEEAIPVSIKEAECKEYTVQLGTKITLNVGQGIVYYAKENLQDIDALADIVNEALAPKQSWAEEEIPEGYVPAPEIAPGAYKLRDAPDEAS